MAYGRLPSPPEERRKTKTAVTCALASGPGDADGFVTIAVSRNIDRLHFHKYVVHAIEPILRQTTKPSRVREVDVFALAPSRTAAC